MSLRALGSLLTRRFAARGIPRAQVESSAEIGIKKATRNLAFGDGSYGPGAAAATALAGFVALLYFNKDTEESAGEVTSVEATKKVGQVVKEGDLDEEAIKAKFMDKDGKVKWLEYLDYLNSQYCGGMLYHKEVSGKQAMDKEIGREAAELKVDEETMHASF